MVSFVYVEPVKAMKENHWVCCALYQWLHKTTQDTTL